MRNEHIMDGLQFILCICEGVTAAAAAAAVGAGVHCHDHEPLLHSVVACWIMPCPL